MPDSSAAAARRGVWLVFAVVVLGVVFWQFSSSSSGLPAVFWFRTGDQHTPQKLSKDTTTGRWPSSSIASTPSALSIASMSAANCRKLHLRTLMFEQLRAMNETEARIFMHMLDVFPAAFMFIVPVFTCPDEERVGGGFDGGKWICGLNRLPPKNCVIYSYGSNGQDQFERDMKTHAPQCDIHTFDPGDHEHKVASGTVLTYHHTGLSAKPDPHRKFRTFHQDTTGLKHDHVDMLKIDIEGAEYEVLPSIFGKENLGKAVPVGQVLVEVHVIPGTTHAARRRGKRLTKFGWAAHRSMMGLLIMFQELHFYLYHAEVNLIWPWGIELAFVNISTLPPEWRPKCNSKGEPL